MKTIVIMLALFVGSSDAFTMPVSALARPAVAMGRSATPAMLFGGGGKEGGGGMPNMMETSACTSTHHVSNTISHPHRHTSA